MEIETSRSALLVLDVQEEIVDGLNAGSTLSRIVAAVEASRRANLLRIFVAVQYRIDYQDASPRNKRVSQLARAKRLGEGDSTSRLHPDLGVRDNEPVVVKRRVSAFAHTDLQPILSAQGVDTLFLCGLSTSGAVLSTLRQAADSDYQLRVLSDGCLDPDPEVQDILTSRVFPQQAETLTVDEFSDALSRN